MLPEVMVRLKVCGYPVAPITDRASTFGWVRWSALAAANNLRPLFGVEIGVTTSLNEKGHDVDHWTFIAKDDIGSVNRLLRLATKQFYNEPLLTYAQALAAEGVVAIAGKRARLEHMGEPKNGLYVALSPSCSKGYIRQVIASGHPWVAASDNRYPTEEDFTFYELTIGRDANTQTYPQHILTDDEWRAAIKTDGEALIAQALRSRSEIADQCVAALKKGELYHPEHPATLRQLCIEGAERIGCDLSRPEYLARMDRELALIEQKNFEDYFFIISDVVRWSRERMIVGPARGSSCGSLVCYLLEITTVDPIHYNLLFERFIDIDRNDLPDIDIDFSDQRRSMVFDYMERKYGREHIARLGTVALFKPRSALQAAGAAFSIPKWRTESFADTLVKRSSGDARALNTFIDGLENTDNGRALLKEWPQVRLATRMEGHPNHYSQHAAAIILTQQPVTDYVAIDDRKGATQCDKKDAEALNLLKIDALGLTQLSIFEDALELAGLPRLHLEKVPRDDEAAFDVLRRGHFAGIFQFNGNSLQSLTKQVPIDTIEDIISITALARPGPMGSGSAMVWVRRRNGSERVSYPHPIFEADLSHTLGIVMYQEQVMQLGRRVGGFTWKEVTALRKAMSKSLGKEYFNQFGDKFIAGALKEGVDHAVAIKVWDDLCAYGSWAFNRSHAVAYGIISYWCCWLKAHHPVEFAAASLSHQTDDDKQLLMLRELAAEGVSYKPVDVDLSNDKWTVGYNADGTKTLIGPISNVKGIGPKMMNEILSARTRGEPLPSRAAKLMYNAKTTLDSLYPIRDEIKRQMPDPGARKIYSAATPISEISDGEFMVFAVLHKIAPRDENEAINVARRGGQVYTDGKYKSVNLIVRDDTGTIYAKVNRFKYESLGAPVVERGGVGKALYAIKGKVFGDTTFKMLHVSAIRFIGMMEGATKSEKTKSQKSSKPAIEDLNENAGV
jgi:DNA polymerase III alpha subunit